MTNTSGAFWIATIWREDDEADGSISYFRHVERRWAENPIVFRKEIEREFADDRVEVGVISRSTDQGR